MKRYYLDALIESYLAWRNREDVDDEIGRLCEVQRSMGYPDYFARRAA